MKVPLMPVEAFKATGSNFVVKALNYSYCNSDTNARINAIVIQQESGVTYLHNIGCKTIFRYQLMYCSLISCFVCNNVLCLYSRVLLHYIVYT